MCIRDRNESAFVGGNLIRFDKVASMSKGPEFALAADIDVISIQIVRDRFE